MRIWKRPAAKATSARHGAPRGIQYTSSYCLRLSRLTWEWLLASAPLDLAVMYLREPPAPNALEGQQDLLVVLLLVAGAGLLREQFFSLVAGLRGFQKKMTSRHVIWLLVGLAVLGLVEIASRLLTSRLSSSLLAILGFAAVAAVSALRNAREMKKHGEKFLKDRFAQVEQANQLHLGLVVGPLVAARAVAVVTSLYAEDSISLIAGTLGSIALLLALYPQEADFMAPCPRCSRMTSRVVKADGCCPQCSPEKFLHRPQ
jgi:uncharacterized membrane protein YuzA (DUF378 family)